MRSLMLAIFSEHGLLQCRAETDHRWDAQGESTLDHDKVRFQTPPVSNLSKLVGRANIRRHSMIEATDVSSKDLCASGWCRRLKISCTGGDQAIQDSVISALFGPGVSLLCGTWSSRDCLSITKV